MAYASAKVYDSIQCPPKELASKNEIVRKDVYEGGFLLYNVLNKSECDFLINQVDKLEWESLCWSQPVLYRKNDRVMLISKEISELIWKRIESFISGIIDFEIKKDQNFLGGTKGKWQPIGLNEKWRICKYTSGGLFGAHYDGSYIKGENTRSFYTFMFYLNEEYEGGRTQFLKDDAKEKYNPSGEDKFLQIEKYQVTGVVNPNPGMALVFPQDLLHEGTELKSGVKYIMRTEIMFEREVSEDTRTFSDDYKEALRLLQMAEDLERCKESEKAAMYYKKAFQLSPKLADEFNY